MKSHHNPDHPRFLTPKTWAKIQRGPKPSQRLHNHFPVQAAPDIDKDTGITKPGILFLGRIYTGHNKDGGYRYYRVDSRNAITFPRKLVKDGDPLKPGVQYATHITGAVLVRITRDGECIPRARNMEPGVTGKSYRRRMRAELRKARAS